MAVGPAPAAARHQRRPLPRARRPRATTTRCSASAPAPNLDDPKRFRFDGEGFYVKSRRRDGGALPRPSRRRVANTLEIAERCDARARPMGSYHMPEFQVPAGTHARGGAGASRPGRGLRARLGLAPDEPIPARAPRVRRAHASTSSRVIQSMGFAGYFLIVADFIGYARAQRHPGRAGARLLGGQPRGLRPRHHRRRSDRVRHHLRALPEPRAHLDARHRRRLLHARARPGDPLRRREVRRRGRRRAGASRRSSPSASSRRAPRCATSGACSGMPYGDVDRIAKLIPDTLGISLDEALEQSPELRARDRGRRPGGAAVRDRAQARGPDAPRLDPRRRRRDRQPAADRDWCRSTATRSPAT